MNEKLKLAIAGGGLVLLTALGAGAALAKPEGHCGPDGGAPWGAMRGDFKAHAEKRLGALHEGLKLRGDQDAAWQDFKRTMLAQAEQMQAKMQAFRDETAGRTAIERIEHIQKGADERRAALDTVATATRTFYAALDGGQKAFFDEHFRLMPQGRHGMGKHRGA